MTEERLEGVCLGTLQGVPSLKSSTQCARSARAPPLVELEGSGSNWPGPNMGPLGSPGRKYSIFTTFFQEHLGCSNNCF